MVEAVWSKMDVSRDGLVSFEEWMSFMNPASDCNSVCPSVTDLSQCTESDTSMQPAWVARNSQVRS